MEISWDLTTTMRIVTIVCIAITVYQLVIMLSHYWWRIIPLRKEIQAATNILAPPVYWSFIYHLLVALISIVLAITLLQGIYYHNHLNAFTIVGPFLYLGLGVAVNRFTAYYSRSINVEYRKAIPGPPDHSDLSGPPS